MFEVRSLMPRSVVFLTTFWPVSLPPSNFPPNAAPRRKVMDEPGSTVGQTSDPPVQNFPVGKLCPINTSLVLTAEG